MLAETDTSGNTVNEYVFFDGMRVARRDSSGNVYYYFGNVLGSAAITTATGSLCYDADFYPFGGEITFTDTCAQNYKFAGMERDSASGLDRTMFRQYSSDYGRWLSPDPSGMGAVSLANPQTWNMYAYVTNNPTSLVDPLGLDSGNCPLQGSQEPDGDVYCYGYEESLYYISPLLVGACFDGGLCPGSNGVPNIYNASYNGPPPTIAYLQSLNYEAAALFLTDATEAVYHNPPPTGVKNVSPDPGYQGSGELDIAERLALFAFDNDPSVSAEYPGEENFVNQLLKHFGKLAASSLSHSNPASACDSRYAQVMSPWRQALLAWLKAHPGQQPPPGIANPPIMPTCSL